MRRETWVELSERMDVVLDRIEKAFHISGKLLDYFAYDANNEKNRSFIVLYYGEATMDNSIVLDYLRFATNAAKELRTMIEEIPIEN